MSCHRVRSVRHDSSRGSVPLNNDDGQTQQCSKLGDSTAKLNHFMLEPHGVEIKNVERHDFSGWLIEPAARC